MLVGFIAELNQIQIEDIQSNLFNCSNQPSKSINSSQVHQWNIVTVILANAENITGIILTVLGNVNIEPNIKQT